jgi:hypothetical protein
VQTYDYEGSFTSMTPIGLVPEGLRIDVGYQATVTEGPATGGRSPASTTSSSATTGWACSTCGTC